MLLFSFAGPKLERVHRFRVALQRLLAENLPSTL